MLLRLYRNLGRTSPASPLTRCGRTVCDSRCGHFLSLSDCSGRRRRAVSQRTNVPHVLRRHGRPPTPLPASLAGIDGRLSLMGGLVRRGWFCTLEWWDCAHFPIHSILLPPNNPKQAAGRRDKASQGGLTLPKQSPRSVATATVCAKHYYERFIASAYIHRSSRLDTYAVYFFPRKAKRAWTWTFYFYRLGIRDKLKAPRGSRGSQQV